MSRENSYTVDPYEDESMLSFLDFETSEDNFGEYGDETGDSFVEEESENLKSHQSSKISNESKTSAEAKTEIRGARTGKSGSRLASNLTISTSVQEEPSGDIGGSESMATVIGAQFVPITPWVDNSKTKASEFRKIEDSHAKPIYRMKLERIRRKERFDAFSEDEEPVLKTEFEPYTRLAKCSEVEIREEKITTFDVRMCLPTFRPDETKGRTGVSRMSNSLRRSTKIQRVPTVQNFDQNFQDFTPQQRDLLYVSYEELDTKEVAVLKGLWKCITYDLWTFGALTTINIFRIMGHIKDNNQKASPQAMMKCRLLWPHAKQAMVALEKSVLNLHKPSISHEVIYEVGRKHGKLKIPLHYDHIMVIIEAFLYTISQHIHPIPTMKEMNILRKFCNITMFLFMDASRWDLIPNIPA